LGARFGGIHFTREDDLPIASFQVEVRRFPEKTLLC
jgi:hypothetical protein